MEPRVDEIRTDLERLEAHTASGQSGQKAKAKSCFPRTTLWCSNDETPHALAPCLPATGEILAGCIKQKGKAEKTTPKVRNVLWA